MNISSKSKRLFDTMLIGLLVLVGVYLVGGATSLPTNLSSNSNISANYTAGGGRDNWTRAGYKVNITFTLNATGPDAINNITIKIPANFTLRSGSLLNYTNYTSGTAYAALGVAINFSSWNGSFVPGKDYYLGWVAGNIVNATWRNLPGVGGNSTGGGLQTNGTVARFTAEFIVDSLPADGFRTWTIYLGSNDSAAGNRTTFTFDMGIDIGEPVVNGTFTATDGTTTLDNATQDFNGTSKHSGLLGNMLTRKFLAAIPGNDVTINFTVIDPNIDTIILRVATENATGKTERALDKGGNYTIRNGLLKTPDNLSFGATITLCNATGISLCNKTGSIINFLIWANDTIGNSLSEGNFVDGIASAGFNFSIVREAPMILTVNNSIKQNWRYSGNQSINISIWANGTGDIPRVYYRYENGSTSDVGPWIEMTNSSKWLNNYSFGGNGFVGCSGNASIYDPSWADGCNYTNYTGTIDTTGMKEGSYNITFKVFNTITNISATANANSNLTTILNFTVDNLPPTIPTLTVSSSSIETGSSVTLTCAGSSDAAASPMGYYIWVKQPGSLSYTNVHSGSTKTYTTTGTIGTYSVKCEARDDLAHSSWKENTAAFSVTYSTSSGSSSGTSGGGAAAEAEFDVDLSGEGLQSGTIKATAGMSKTLSFDGSTTHKITVTAVTADSATIKIESEPIEITLKVGDSKEVDVNGDKVNDINVKLKAIKNAEAEVEITELVGATTVAQEEVKAAEEAAAKAAEEGEKAAGEGEVTPTAGVAKGTTWIWVTAVIVVTVIVVGVILAGKKKKK